MSIHYKLSGLSLLVLLLASMCLIGVHSAGAQTDQAESKLQEANNAINQAFTAVLDAEKAGANVTDLMFQQNYATGILAQAENSYRTGYFNKAAAQADNVLPIAQQITTSAQNAKQNAIISSQNAFWLTIAYTVIGIVMLIEVLFLVWLWLKRRYIKNLSEAKPEVTVNEAQ